MNECPHCNTRNPPQAVTCRVCNLTLPRTNAPSLLHTTNRPKMAVFDLDKTLFDLSRRERAARRQGLKEGTDKWYEFLNQNKYILMDTPMPGTVSFVKQLSDNGFTIAYLSGRPRHTLAATKQSLQENGFPIDAAEQDLVFLHSGKGSIKNITNHKKTVLTHLKNSFDIDFFFDDTPEFRQAAKSLFIPGVYSCISSYTGNETRTSAPKKKGRSKKARNNPGHGEHLCHRTTAIDPYTGIYYACSKPEGHSGPHDFSIEMVAPDAPGFDGDNPFDNPVPKPRKKRNKSGKMVKEPVKKYMDRFMGDAKMNEEFPDRSQRFAVAATTARKFYGDKAVDKAYPRDNPRSNPHTSVEKLAPMVVKYFNLSSEIFAENNEAWENAKEVNLLKKYDPGAQKARKKKQVITLHNKLHDNILKLLESHSYESIKAALNKSLSGVEVERWLAGKPKLLGTTKASLSFSIMTAYEAGEDWEWIEGLTDLDKPAKRVAIFSLVKNNPRSNPHTPVSDAKEFYKQFHQKPAKTVKKTKVDIGDTWVGLGKAWSIGYRSGKETGNEAQKYIHNFGVDEESGKQFKEPDLYYVKNNDGSQMMVIMGGDWYIDVDEEGQMSWIYI